MHCFVYYFKGQDRHHHCLIYLYGFWNIGVKFFLPLFLRLFDYIYELFWWCGNVLFFIYSYQLYFSYIVAVSFKFRSNDFDCFNDFAIRFFILLIIIYISVTLWQSDLIVKGDWNTWRKPDTCSKSLINYHIKLYHVHYDRGGMQTCNFNDDQH